MKRITAICYKLIASVVAAVAKAAASVLTKYCRPQGADNRQKALQEQELTTWKVYTTSGLEKVDTNQALSHRNFSGTCTK